MAVALRHPFDRNRWPRQLAVHVAAALSYSVVHTAIMMAVRTLLLLIGQELPANFPGWWNYTLLSYLTQLDWLLMTYLFLIGVAHALAYRRESEARALNTAQLETRLVEAQLGRFSVSSTALPVQYPEYGVRAHSCPIRTAPTG